MGEERINLEELAGRLEGIYEEFTESVQALGKKTQGRARSSKMAGSFAHWIGGSHVVTDRESLCEKFLKDVQGHLELLLSVFEGADEEEIKKACIVVSDILLRPCPEKSDATTDLMKRAMTGQAKPFLTYLPKEQLGKIKTQMEDAYGKWKMLPIEKEIYKEVKRLL